MFHLSAVLPFVLECMYFASAIAMLFGLYIILSKIRQGVALSVHYARKHQHLYEIGGMLMLSINRFSYWNSSEKKPNYVFFSLFYRLEICFDCKRMAEILKPPGITEFPW